MHWILCCLTVAAVGVAGCSADTTTSGESTGSLDLTLELAPGVVINEVRWVISRLAMEDMDGTIDTSAPGATASVEVFGLPPGDGYTVTLTAMAEGEDTPCIGSADFSVAVGISTPVMVMLNCKRPERLGGVRVNGKVNVCAELAKVIVSPLQTSVGNDIDLSALAVDVDDDQEAIKYLWTATGGSIADPTDRITTYTCEEVGDHTILIQVSDDPDIFGEFCMDEWDVDVTCVEGDGLECVDNGDCDAGEICVENECVPDLECVGDDECGPLELCIENACIAVDCKIDDHCDTEEICIDNECRSDPDGFCDTGICAESEAAKELCVQSFITCLLDNPDEEECILLSILLCNECNEDSDCDAGQVCNDDNVCEATAEVFYAQDFNELPINPGGLIGDGWKYFVNVFEGNEAYRFGYGGDAPQGPQISNLVTTEGGPEQEPQQLVVYSDYECCAGGVGHQNPTDLVETNVFQERTIGAADVGKTFTFMFQAKGGNLGGSTTANGFIKTLDPGAGFSESAVDRMDTTGLPDTWGGFTVSITIPNDTFIGHILQFGFQTNASNGEDSANFYDNVLVTVSDGNGGGSCVEPALPNWTVNGDFETGDTCGWEFFPNDGTFAATMAESNGGLWSGNLVASVPGGGGPPSFPVIKQANIGIGTVQPNSSVDISFDLFGSVSGAGGVFFAEFFSELDGGGTSKSEILGGSPLFPDGTWTTYSFTTTTGNDVSGGVTLQLKADCGANPGCTVDAYIDNVSVMPTPP